MSTLRELLAAVGEPLITVLAAPAGLDVPISGLAIVDPEDAPDEHRGGLVLVVGARGRDAAPLVRAAGAAGAAAVAVKVGAAGRADAVGGHADEREALRAAAVEAGVALLAVPADVRWERLESLAAGVLDASEAAGPDDLFALAQTVALLTHGIVCIEDTASRVLAYSRSDRDDGQIDELRRLSILGWQGPADYLRHLREWGVFDRLRTGEEVVRVDEHADLGVRRRLAVGIHAGPRVLGTIWVQEGAQPFSPRAEDVLVGAARVAAGHLVRRRRAAPTWHRDLVEGLLDGRASPDLVAGTFGLDEHAPTVVVGFAVRAGEGVTRELSVAELADVVAVHAAGYRRAALTAWRGDTVYAVLPDVAKVDAALRAMCAEVVAVTHRRTGVRVQAGIGDHAAGTGRRAVPRPRHSPQQRHPTARRPRRCPRRCVRPGGGAPRRRSRWGPRGSRACRPPAPKPTGCSSPCPPTTTWPRSTTCAPRCCSTRPSPCSASGPTCATRPSTRSWPTTTRTAATSRARCWPGSTPTATSAPPPARSPCTPTRCATACGGPSRWPGCGSATPARGSCTTSPCTPPAPPTRPETHTWRIGQLRPRFVVPDDESRSGPSS